MLYLSKKGFIHRDLAARNVLLDWECRCKVGKRMCRIICAYNSTRICMLVMIFTLFYIICYMIISIFRFQWAACRFWHVKRLGDWLLLQTQRRYDSCEVDSSWGHFVQEVHHKEWCMELWDGDVRDMVTGTQAIWRLLSGGGEVTIATYMSLAYIQHSGKTLKMAKMQQSRWLTYTYMTKHPIWKFCIQSCYIHIWKCWRVSFIASSI